MYEKYAAIRDALGYTDAKVADELDIPASSIYDWKQRAAVQKDASMSVKTLYAIAKLFKVHIEDLLEER